MNVLVTGATGYVGSAVVGALLVAGHGVSGLTRSGESDRKLAAAGASAVTGDMTDAGSVKSAGGGGGVVGDLVGWAREQGVGKFVSPPGGEPSWTLVHRDDLGDPYARLLVSELAGGTLLVAAGDGPYRVREIAAAASSGRGRTCRAVAPPRSAGEARRLRRCPGPRPAALR